METVFVSVVFKDTYAVEGSIFKLFEIFFQAILENQLLNIDERFDELLQIGIPEEGRAYLGMTGFKVRINLHGELLEVIQPGMVDPEE